MKTKEDRFRIVCLVCLWIGLVLTPLTGQCFYNPNSGRWLSRDPAGEGGGANVNAFVSNDAVNKNDPFGLWATSVHHQIVEDWLTDPKYRNYPWRCCSIDVVRAIQGGSDDVDGVFHNGLPSPIAWCEAQSSVNSYQHAMSDGAANQSASGAQAMRRKTADVISWSGPLIALEELITPSRTAYRQHIADSSRGGDPTTAGLVGEDGPPTGHLSKPMRRRKPLPFTHLRRRRW